MPSKLRELEHERRADRHHKVGCALVDAGDEWAAVPLFYCAYHLVKAAMLVDPIWDSISDLQQLHVDLIPDDRFVERHKGRRGGGRGGGSVEWGLNDLVLRLYRPIASDYTTLHTHSVTVRYGVGLPDDADLSALRDRCERIRAMYAAGQIVAPLPASDQL